MELLVRTVTVVNLIERVELSTISIVLFCPAANIYRVIGNCKNVKSAVMQRKKAKGRNINNSFEKSRIFHFLKIYQLLLLLHLIQHLALALALTHRAELFIWIHYIDV